MRNTKRFGKSARIATILLTLGFGLASMHNGCSQVKFNAPGTSDSKAAIMSAPFIQINGGAPYTQSKAVGLLLESPGADEMYITNTPDCSDGGTWEPFAAQRAWVLKSDNDKNSVFARFRSKDKGQTACVSADILHDDIAPTVSIDVAVPNITNKTSISSSFFAADSGSGVAEYLCIYPGQTSAVPCSNLYSSADFKDGSHVLQFLASDKAGNISKPLQQNFLVDTTPPTVMINSKPPLFAGTNEAKFEFSGMDSLSGLKGFKCKLDNQAQYADCVSGQTYTMLAEGEHNFSVISVDVATNESAPATYKWTVDTKAPNVKFTQTPPAYSNVPTATFAFTGSESDGTPLMKYECRIDNGAFAPCTSPQDLAGLNEGSHVYGVRGQSRSGVYSGEATYAWLIDLTAPKIEITSGPQPLTNLNTATFTFTANDGGSGIKTITCKLDNDPAQDCSKLVINLTALTGDREHVFQVTAVDAAGNAGMSAAYKWYIDNTPPTVQITAMPPALSPSMDANFDMIGRDDHSTVVTYVCDIDGTQFLACVPPKAYADLKDGKHTFSVKAMDEAGNFSAVASYAWTINTTGPVIQFTKVPDPTILTTTQGQLTYSVTDDVSPIKSITCMLDKTSVSCSGNSSTLTFPLLSVGYHTFTLTASDSAGLSSNKSYTFYVREPVCTTTLTNTTVLTKMLFIVDTSGSNGSGTCTLGPNCTDLNKKMRAGSIQTFYDNYGPKTNFNWAFNYFQNTSSSALINSGSPSSPIFSDAVAMQNAITAFKSVPDTGNTPYMAALNLATKLVSNDPDLNSSKKPQYIVVFMSDGQPTDTGSVDYVAAVKTIAGLAPGRVSFNTIYYGPVNATATTLMQNMATAGSGNFLNTNTNPTGLDFKISDVISIPVMSCN